jgi:hypothetical protein
VGFDWLVVEDAGVGTVEGWDGRFRVGQRIVGWMAGRGVGLLGVVGWHFGTSGAL